MSANTRTRGSAENSAQVNRLTALTSGTGKTVKSHVAGSNGGTPPAWSTGHLRVCTCRGGMRLDRCVSGLTIGSSDMATPQDISPQRHEGVTKGRKEDRS